MAAYGIITATELKAKLDAGEKFRLIDVREPSEYYIANIPGAELKPLGQIMQWVLHCHHGMRSDRACQFLAAQGFTKLKNLTGGIDDWSLRVDPAVPRY
jgi:rhodanese-related sulfurtransferase